MAVTTQPLFRVAVPGTNMTILWSNVSLKQKSKVKQHIYFSTKRETLETLVANYLRLFQNLMKLFSEECP